MRRGCEAPGPPPACGLLLLGAPVMPVPRPLSLGVVLCPEVAAPELSLLRGIWLWAEAMPLETNNAAAANMAEHLLMSSFLSSSVCAAVQGRGAGVPRCFVVARAQTAAVPRHCDYPQRTSRITRALPVKAKIRAGGIFGHHPCFFPLFRFGSLAIKLAGGCFP